MDIIKNQQLHYQALLKIADLLNIPHTEGLELFELHNVVSTELNVLITNDFNKVVSILYRVDVSELKLREEIARFGHKETAGKTLTRLLVKREVEKIGSRAEYKAD